MGRPPVLPKKKKDGFWLEIRNKGANSGVVIIRDSYETMMQAVRQYENTKVVIVLGEHKNGKKVDDGKKKKAKSEA
jgi:surface antigen